MLTNDDFWLTEAEMENIILSDESHQTSENTSMMYKTDYESSLFLEDKIINMPYFDRISNMDRGWINDLCAFDSVREYNVSLSDSEKFFNHQRQELV